MSSVPALIESYRVRRETAWTPSELFRPRDPAIRYRSEPLTGLFHEAVNQSTVGVHVPIERVRRVDQVAGRPAGVLENYDRGPLGCGALEEIGAAVVPKGIYGVAT